MVKHSRHVCVMTRSCTHINTTYNNKPYFADLHSYLYYSKHIAVMTYYTHPLICIYIYTNKIYFDPDVIWTRNLLIWSQTRYRCATESAYLQLIRPRRDRQGYTWGCQFLAFLFLLNIVDVYLKPQATIQWKTQYISHTLNSDYTRWYSTECWLDILRKHVHG